MKNRMYKVTVQQFAGDTDQAPHEYSLEHPNEKVLYFTTLKAFFQRWYDDQHPRRAHQEFGVPVDIAHLLVPAQPTLTPIIDKRERVYWDHGKGYRIQQNWEQWESPMLYGKTLEVAGMVDGCTARLRTGWTSYFFYKIIIKPCFIYS